MTNSPISGAAQSAAPTAAFPTSATPTPGVLETPDNPVSDALVRSPAGDSQPTVVIATPVAPAPPPALPYTIGLQPRQRIALQALASGQSPHVAAELAGVNRVTVFRWRKYDAKFIAAWNTWQAESQKTARDLLAAANEYAARTVLRAAQNGDVRVSLAVLKGLGTLAPQEVGRQFARAVEIELSSKLDKTRSSMGGMTRDIRKLIAKSKSEEKKKAKADAERVAAWQKYFDEYLQIPPLPRPVTHPAIEQWVNAAAGRLLTYPKQCSFTIAAMTGDRDPLATAIAAFDQITIEAVQNELNTLPHLLNGLLAWDRAETFAQNLESLGATVELRPGWRKVTA